MKLILLYGAPATGKLTVAKELQKLGDFKLLHNHLVVDLIETIDGDRTPEFFELYEKIMTDMVNFAIKKDVSLINTFVYAHGVDTKFMDFMKKTVESGGGQIYFVQLKSDREEVLKRVRETSRQEFNKLTDPDKLASLMDKYDLATPYEGTDLVIDNTEKSAKEVAKEVYGHLMK